MFKNFITITVVRRVRFTTHAGILRLQEDFALHAAPLACTDLVIAYGSEITVVLQ